MVPTPPTSRSGDGAAVTLAEILATPAFAGSSVLAGGSGLGRTVERLNVMEVPDIAAWAKPREFLLTSSYPVRDSPERLAGLVVALDDAGLAGIGIKLGRYLDDLPDDAVAAADTRGFPVVRLPPRVTFDELLTEAFTVILHRHAARLARSERIHRAFLDTVLHGGGPTQIAQGLADLLDAPAAILSLRGEVLAEARFAEAGLDRAAPVAVDLDRGVARSGDVSLPCIGLAITAGARVFGHVVALAAPRPDSDDLLALENAATVAALALTMQREVAAVEDKYRSDLVHDLLRGAGDRDEILRRGRRFGWRLDRRTVVVILRPDRPDGTHGDGAARSLDPPHGLRMPLSAALQSAIAARDPHAATVQISDDAVALVDAAVMDDTFAQHLLRAADQSSGDPVSGGVSRPVDGPEAISIGYEQAVRALVIGRRVHGHGRITRFDELGAHRLLALVDDHGELLAFAHEVLGELARDDAAAADLRHTLRVLLESGGGNVAEIARRLHFHYNTVRKRIARLEAMLGPFMTDGRLRLDIHLALLVHSMHDLAERRIGSVDS